MSAGIPVECAEFRCTLCGSDEQLDYKLKRLRQTGKGEYEFTATLTCNKCNTHRTLKKLLRSLASIFKISVGPVEIGIDNRKLESE